MIFIKTVYHKKVGGKTAKRNKRGKLSCFKNL